jgi:choline dehydrogenase-like flavoprotein
MPFYRRAEKFFNVLNRRYDDADWPKQSLRPPSFDEHDIQFRYSQFARQPNLAEKHRAQLASARRLRVLVHAAAVEVVPSAVGRQIENVAIRSLSGRSGKVSARAFVLACGAIEVARLLLASRRASNDGLGNHSGLVGRCFQEHAHLKIPVAPANRRRLQRMFHTRQTVGARLYPKIAASVDLQMRCKILNVGADICYEMRPDSPTESAKLLVRAIRHRELRGQLPAAIGRTVAGLDTLTAALYRHLAYAHKISEGDGTMYLCVQCESPARRENSVELTDERDALGLPKAKIRWALKDLEWRSITTFANLVDEAFRNRGLGRLDVSRLVAQNGDRSELIDAGHHHMGTTRMNANPKLGVVDSECKVHHLGNLWVASAAVFPTGGYSNPTLTIVALSLRIADQLKVNLG